MSPARRRPALKETAADFALRNQHGETVETEQLRGAPSVLMFYPFAFSQVCGSELTEIQARWADLAHMGVRLCAISCDSVHTLRAYAERLGEIRFDLLSDFWPHGAVAQAFGAFDVQKGCPTRETFVLDAQLRVRRTVSAEFTQSRDFTEVLDALRAIRRD
ncbi:redoxin domain-containing protein [Nesterenkonia haasae]|uniref:redoxin domain-containing protein n=1 Tax=Nesterenkonia haasae TaxID=2587813 RepID=UPI00192EAA01|nr:redoxin domain-containing protein [Nesterenkonia haasae]